MDTLNQIESAILKKMLSGDESNFKILREQYMPAKVTQRENAGVGFFTNFFIPPDAPRLPDSVGLEITNVSADVEGLVNGADFILFVRDGAIAMLEGFAYDGPWPEDPKLLRLFYNELSSRRLNDGRNPPSGSGS
ncbi:hypothetical protein [Methylocella silvestris]|uniref:hypothetical protein n=1 Tax=Methylocella silvestris TaxID=199596 RepID=UPI0011D154B1|nr:hypothetical protein [Methylocella silvestris]